MPKIVTMEPDQEAVERPAKAASKATQETVDAGAKAARTMIEEAPKTLPQAEKATRAGLRVAEEAADQGKQMLGTLAEQTRRNMETTDQMAHAVSWPDLVVAQREFLASSFERARQLQESYLALVRATYKAMLLPNLR